MGLTLSFFQWFAIAVTAVAFVGFAPTYFLKGYFDTPSLSPLLHLHGILFSCWLVLLVVQASLVAMRRVADHRRTGVAGLLLAAAMVVIGTRAAVESARAGLSPSGLDPLTFLAVPIGALVMFAVFLAVAIARRRSPDVHRRLVALATIAIITPAVARLWFVHQRPPLALALTNVFLIALAAYDWRTLGRLHRASLWGGLVIALSGPARIAIGGTGAWHRLARWLVE